MSGSPRRLLPVALAAIALPAFALAQTFATVTQLTPQCQAPSPVSGTMTVQATPPVTGGTCRITSYGPNMGASALVLSTAYNYLGFDLSFLGAPGCRLYVDPTIGATVSSSSRSRRSCSARRPRRPG